MAAQTSVKTNKKGNEMSTQSLRAMGPRHVFSVLVLACVAACGGGTPAQPQAQAQTQSTGQASLVTPASFHWRIDTPVQIELKDAQGQTIAPAAVTCSAQDARVVEVSTDCSRIKPLRIGALLIQVRGGGVTAGLTVDAKPAPVWTGLHGPVNSGFINYVPVVTPDGRVLVWGGNSFGLLAQGESEQALQSVATPVAALRSSQAALSDVAAVAAGTQHALALTRDGLLLAWGSNDAHALGTSDGAYINGSLFPVAVMNPSDGRPLDHFVQIDAGSTRSTALRDDGTVYAWGTWPGTGKVDANGDALSTTLPEQVRNVAGTGALERIVAVSAGWSHTLALDDAGQVYAWGFDSGGDLGDGVLGAGKPSTVSDRKPLVLPVRVIRSDGKPLSDIVQISAGYNFNLALDASGGVWAWGANEQAQLGLGAQTPASQFTAVRLAQGVGGLPSNIKMVAAGGLHALALTEDGKVYAWGFATSGQIGEGSNRVGNYALTPMAVMDPLGTTQLSQVVSIAAGYNISMALTADGRVLTWGSAFRDALGRPTGGLDSRTPGYVVAEQGAGQLTLAPSAYPRLTGRAR